MLQEMMAGSLADPGWDSREVLDARDLCLSCKGCLSECPTGVDMASYKSEFLAHHYATRRRPRSHTSLGQLPRWLRLGWRMAPLANTMLRTPGIRGILIRIAGISPERAIPPIARRPFVVAHHARVAAPVGSRGRVTIWPDTFTNYLAPAVGHAAVRVVEAAGYTAQVPREPVCCALTWVTTGQLDGARAVLRRTLDAASLAGDEPVVVLEPSCAASLRMDLPELLPDDPRAAALAARVMTLAELLDRDGTVVGADPPVPLRAAVSQPHCHQQAVLGRSADLRVLDRHGVTVERQLEGCCGLAGNFGAEPGHETISRQVAALELVPALARAAADDLVLADGFSCRTQIAALSGHRARHLAEVLADRLSPDHPDPDHPGPAHPGG
jgi:Fe-S oxidoreductase